MHIYDPDGTYERWRRRKRRDETVASIVFGAGCVVVLLTIGWLTVSWDSWKHLVGQ